MPIRTFHENCNTLGPDGDRVRRHDFPSSVQCFLCLLRRGRPPDPLSVVSNGSVPSFFLFQSLLADRVQLMRLRSARSSVEYPRSWSLDRSCVYFTRRPSIGDRTSQHAPDDVQISGSFRSSAVAHLQFQSSACVDDVACCMCCYRIQLNAAKIDVMRCSNNRRQHHQCQ